MIYEPGEDSYLIEKYVKKYAKGKVLDIGTGSGILALAANEKADKILAVDIDPECVSCVKKKGINAVVSDLFENVSGKFDLISFNPPYLPKDEKEDDESRRITTGGGYGYEIIERFLKDAKKFLNKDGKILIVVSSLTGDVEHLFKKYKFKFKMLEEQSHFFEKLRVYTLN